MKQSEVVKELKTLLEKNSIENRPWNNAVRACLEIVLKHEANATRESDNANNNA